MRRLRPHVAQDDRRAFEPTGAAERPEVGDQVKVTIALLPVGEVVPRNRLHLHVDRQQVIAGVGSAFRDLRDKMVDVEPLSQEAAVNVRKDGQDRVDLAGSGQLLQLATLQKSRRFGHQECRPSFSNVPRGESAREPEEASDGRFAVPRGLLYACAKPLIAAP